MITAKVTESDIQASSSRVSGSINIDGVSAVKVLWYLKSLIKNPSDSVYHVKNGTVFFTSEDFQRLCNLLTDISTWRYFEAVNMIFSNNVQDSKNLLYIAKSVYKFNDGGT